MLYATKHARPDTCTSIAFLTTRVCEPDKDDWAKLCHLMKYIRDTHKIPLILSANGSGILKWWVNASFAIEYERTLGNRIVTWKRIFNYKYYQTKVEYPQFHRTEIVGADDMEKNGKASSTKRTKHINIR